jgi:hypothetical protein
MQKQAILTIVIPCIFERINKLQYLYNKLQLQIDRSGCNIQILSIVDNMFMHVGEKRTYLLNNAGGEYISFVDDDDDISDDYIESIMNVLRTEKPDVITFNTNCYLDDNIARPIYMRLKQKNTEVTDKGAFRAAWHTNVWKKELVKMVTFPSVNYGEDWEWAKYCNDICETEVHIDKLLYSYIFSKSGTRTQ